MDRDGVLRIRRGRRRHAGVYVCRATAAASDTGRRPRSTAANTTVRFHRLEDALQLAKTTWTNLDDVDDDDAVDVEGLRQSAVMRLGPLSYRLSVHHQPPETYSVSHIQHRIVPVRVITSARGGYVFIGVS